MSAANLFELLARHREVERLVDNEIRRLTRRGEASISASIIAANIISRRAPGIPEGELREAAADTLRRRWGR